MYSLKTIVAKRLISVSDTFSSFYLHSRIKACYDNTTEQKNTKQYLYQDVEMLLLRLKGRCSSRREALEAETISLKLGQILASPLIFKYEN